MFPPERIICFTEETVETLYLLGEESRIVGISGYVVRPPTARRDKPRVSPFTSADIPKILERLRVERGAMLVFAQINDALRQEQARHEAAVKNTRRLRALRLARDAKSKNE